ncbi:MAG: cation transporter, partial [Chloroflexia bacterium]|nr:cation transporter [Chloroflexia bacterium]
MNDALTAESVPEAARSAQNSEHDRNHDHAHAAPVIDQPPRVDRRPLVIAMGITATFLVVEVIGAYLSNSLALLADAAHMLTDVAAIGLALFAMWLAGRPTRAERTFGHLRAEILAALVNAVTLIVMA